MTQKNIIILLIIGLLVVGGVFFVIKKNNTDIFKGDLNKNLNNESGPFSENYQYTNIPLTIAGKTIQVDLAQTPAERTLGLSGRKTIVGDKKISPNKELSDYGMLFVFEKPDIYGFWMNEMLFSIDIIWLDEEKRVIYIEKNATPESFPKTFTSTKPAKYVLEVVAGFSDMNGLKIGDQASF